MARLEPGRIGGPVRQVTRTLGFGLLEAIVALVILGSAGLMLFGWINSNLVTASRLKDVEQRAQWRLEAQAWLTTLNPAKQAQGETAIGKLRLTWRSDLVEPMRDEFNLFGNLEPRWRLGLYRVSAQLREGDGAPVVDWQQLVAGWRLRSGNDAGSVTAGVR